MSMRTAIMEMYGPKSPERAAWVPESIADEQVEAFMEATVAAIAEGEDTFVFEGKHYKAKTKKEDKLDPVGKEDDDVDNDGDVDSSDKYLKKRRSAIAKRRAMDEEMDPTKHVSKKGDMYCVYNKDGEEVAKFDNEEEANAYAIKNHDALMGKEEMDEVSYKTAMKSYQKAMGQSKDADDAGDKKTGDKKFDQAVKFGRYANKKFQSSRNKKKLVGTLTKEETVEVEENYTDKQDASYRDEPTPKGAQKRLKALHKKALAYRKKHGVFPSVRKRQKDLAMKKAKSDLKFESVEEAVSVKKQDYKWGRMMTVHHGKSHSYPLHPEHQSAIKKLGDNQKTSFKDETGTKVTAHRQGDTVHLSSSKTNAKTPVAHSHFKESVQEAAKPTAQHGPDTATSDTFQKQMGGGRSPREKEFVDMHKTEIGLDVEKITAQNKQSIEDALKQTPARLGDQRKGDTSFVNPIKADIIDGITKALQQMKTNN